MADYVIKQCKKDETEFIKQFMQDIRKADLDELLSLTGNNPEREIIESVSNSIKAYKGTSADNKPLVLYGITKVQNVAGFMIWCVGTNELARYEKSFIKVSHAILKTWLKKYKRLYNFTSVKNKKSIKWLRWLGATFSEPFSAGEKKEKFIYFILEE